MLVRINGGKFVHNDSKLLGGA